MLNPPNSSRPVVLVTASLASPLVSPMVCDALRAEAENAMSHLRALGAEVRFIEASVPQAPASGLLSEHIAGLVVLGGADIDPTLYAQEANTDTLYGVNRAADELEASLIAAALVRKLPVFGICRGLQLINVVHGGTLIQDLGQPTLHNATSDNAIMVRHEVEVLPGSRLADIMGTDARQVLSGHHQAIGRLGKGLRASARAADGVIEAVEHTDGAWLLGVQWHPEDPAASVEDLYPLLNAFLAACREDAPIEG